MTTHTNLGYMQVGVIRRTLAATMLVILALGTEVVPGLSNTANAQEVIEEIIVTSRKREESLQDVPFAVQALTGDQIVQRGITSLEELANNVAGFSVQNLGPGQSQVAIRGISAGQIVRDQPGVKEQVGVYLDESVISLSLFTPDLDFYDMNRVEVLRGPQGTLFGSGSASGTVRYISNQPNLDATEGSFQFGVNSIKDGGVGGDFKGMFNLPLGDNVAARFVAYSTSYGGYVDAVQPGDFINEDVNDGTRFGLRASLRFEPSDQLTITPRIIYQDINMNGFNREDVFNVLANPFTTTRPAITLGEYQQYTQLQEDFTDEFLLADLLIEYDIGSVALTSVTSFTDREILVLRDASALTLGVIGLLGLDAFGTPLVSDAQAIDTLDGPLYDRTDIQVVTQELRLASTGDGRLDWVVGVFYSDIERLYGQDLPVTGFETLTGISTVGVINPRDSLFFSSIPYDFEQLALFGEATFRFTDRFALTVGARYYDFDENRILNFDGIFAAQSIGVPGSASSDGVNPRVMLSFDLNDDMQLNAQVSEGFRLGGINDPLNTGACSPEDFATFNPFATDFGDEEVTNFEIGLKSTLGGGSSILNVSVFTADIDGLQATLDGGTCSSRVVVNVADSTSSGVEVEYTANLSDSFSLAATGSYIDTSIDSTLLSGGSPLGGVRDGNRFPTVPELQLAVSGTFDFTWNSNWDGYLTATVLHVGERFTQLVDQEPGVGQTNPTIVNIGAPSDTDIFVNPELESYEMVNVRLGARMDSWELAAYINNLLDERVLQSLDRELGGVGRLGYRVGPPLTIGASISYSFD